MTFEDQVELAMRSEALQIDPPISELVAGGVARGRDLQRRARVRTAAGSVAVVLVAAAGTVVALPLLTGDGGSPPVAAGDPASTEADPVGDQAPQPANEIDPEAVLDAVVALLPPGEVTDAGSSSDGPSSAWFQFAYDDGDGASWMMGSVHLVAGDESAQCPVIVNGGGCEVRDVGAAGTVTLLAGPYYPQPDREPDRLLWSAHASAPRGLMVMLSEMNTPTEKDSEPTRAEPPLSLDQLSAVVTDGVWAELTAGIAPSPPPDEPEPLQPEITAEAQAFAAALGAGWTPVDIGVADPDPSLRAGLPDSYTMGSATLVDLGHDVSLEEHCTPGEEKGSVKEACVSATAPDGRPIHLQWGGTVPDGPYAQNSLEDSVSVLVTDGSDRLVRVSLWVAEPAGSSTPERRETARVWLGEQVDGLARAATAALAGQLG